MAVTPRIRHWRKIQPNDFLPRSDAQPESRIANRQRDEPLSSARWEGDELKR